MRFLHSVLSRIWNRLEPLTWRRQQAIDAQVLCAGVGAALLRSTFAYDEQYDEHAAASQVPVAVATKAKAKPEPVEVLA